MKSVCVYCGSKTAKEFLEATEELGKWFARKKITLVYGGGKVGLMGVLSKSVMDHGGEVVGIIPKFLVKEEIAHLTASQLINVDTLYQRKLKTLQLSGAFVVLPGGVGTVRDFTELLTLKRHYILSKPILVLNINGYYTPMLQMLKQMADMEMLPKERMDDFQVFDQVAALTKYLESLDLKIDESLEKLELV